MPLHDLSQTKQNKTKPVIQHAKNPSQNKAMLARGHVVRSTCVDLHKDLNTEQNGANKLPKCPSVELAVPPHLEDRVSLDLKEMT